MFRNLFRISIILSLLIHFGTVLMLTLKERTKEEKKEYIEVTFEESKPIQKQRRQIVQQNSKPLNDEIPEHAKFMGEHNQKVVKETRAAKSGEFTNQADLVDAKETPQKQAKPKSKVGKGLDLKDKTLNGMPILQALKPNFDWEKVNENSQGSKRQTASKTDDYLKDVAVSAQTLLSTREFLYYSYYNRIRAQLKQYWEPRIKDKMKKIFDQGRNIASDEDRVTKVVITLDQKGILVKVQVIGESGVRDLDDAAIEAFRQAAPFPNPPKGIIDADGLIKIRWDFILEA
ncbi:MAG: TonB family protein [Bdellovibrionales bacterium]